jgi:adenylate cyclase
MDAVATHFPPMQAARSWRAFRRRVTLRRLRLSTGFVLFTYVTVHLGNHALGNASFGVMEDTLDFLSYIWLNPIVTFILYGSLLTHLGLGLWALYQRRWHSVRPAEIVQLVLGLSIPFILFNHIEVTRISHEIYGTWRGYGQELYALWILSPIKGDLQLVLLIVAWIHGSIGLHFWLRLRPVYTMLRAVLLAAAVLLPALAMLGYLQGSRMVEQLSKQPDFVAYRLTETDMGSQAQNAALWHVNLMFLGGYGGAIAIILLARGARVAVERRGGLVRLTRTDGAVMVVPRGTTVLEAARRYKIPHASVCGGRGRCSTCRIWLMGDPTEVPPPLPAESAVLATLKVGPSVRLACQLRPEHDLAFALVLPPNAPLSRAYPNNRQHATDERMIVAMFVDMRGSTRLAEHRLPYDTVFIINRFHEAVGNAIVAAGGATNQLLGDGVLALFGLRNEPREASRQAMQAAIGIAYNIAALNRFMESDLGEPIRFGIGIHAGTAIVGDIGYQGHTVFTAVGDPVNTAARLQDQTKVLHCEVVISEDVYRTADLAGDALPQHEIFVAGREAPIRVRAATTTADLAAMA